MPSQATDDHDLWPVVTWAAPLLLVAAALLIVPPGTLPFLRDRTYSDAALAHWPNAYYLRHAVWQHHQWPLWNPLTMLGQPFAANPLTKVWYPPQWLALILPPTLHLNLMIALHLALLARGAVGWAREMGLGIGATCLLALGLALNLKLLAHLGAGHLDILYALAWVPWVLWAGARLAAAPSLRRGLWMGVTAALTVLADVRIAFYTLPLVGLVTLWHLLARRRQLADAIPLTAAAASALLLTAVLTLPLIALAPYMTRSSITLADASLMSLPLDHLIGVVLPDASGAHEWMTYLGLPLLVLAGVAVVRSPRRDRWLWLGAALLAALWALGDNGPLFEPVVRLLPLVGWFRVPPRVWFVTGLSTTVLAAYGLDVIDGAHGSAAGRLAAAGMASAGLTAIVAALTFDAAGQLGGLGPAGISLLLGGAGLWMVQMGDGAGRDRAWLVWGRGAVVASVVAPNLLMGGLLIEGRSLTGAIASDGPLVEALAGRCDRVFAPSYDLVGIAPMAAGIPTLHAAEPFQLQASVEAIAAAAEVPLRGYSIVVPSYVSSDGLETAVEPADPDSDLLAALGVGVVVSRGPLSDARLSAIDSPAGWYLYDVAGSAPLFVAPQDVDAPLQPSERIVHAACDPQPNRLLDAHFDTLPFDGPVVLVLPQAWLPGWKAQIDGQPAPVIQVGGVLLGVELDPTGPHDVEIYYRPSVDLIGVAISGISALLLIAYAVVTRTRREAVDG